VEAVIMSMTTFIIEKYDDTFESVYAALAEMVRQNPDQARQTIRGILKDLYVRQGLDWTGRGAIGDAGIDASIAAYECILAEQEH
jgi:hypothetical protein